MLHISMPHFLPFKKLNGSAFSVKLQAADTEQVCTAQFPCFAGIFFQIKTIGELAIGKMQQTQ